MSSEADQTQQSSQSNVSDVPNSQNSSKSNTASFDAMTMKASVTSSVSRLTSKKKIFPILKEHIRPWYDNDKEYVLEIYKSMMTQLDMMITEEIEMMFDSSNLNQLLSELDTIKQENKASEIWRPSGNAKEDLAAHLQESSEKELEHLGKLHDALLSKNKWLNECMQRTSSKIESSVKALDTTLKGWNDAASAVTTDTQEDVINIVHKFSAVNFLEEEC